ncbi:hypothetical protein Q0Z83_060100 [Actinoplanes sichuanensis]|uniref:Phage tail protein n=1 Tax=Actinoplanes sichuanensis TaxID=512349 RepID=A0ABW4A6A6_9ACTN|nr:hypothetical protein [Actinoplanes sichuanensis]BEL07819.1 hypothetical protein Q0Z83_060100 [Actinoplanes sichuanensis]
MTFLVRVGFSTGAGVPEEYLRLDDPVAGLLDVGLLAPDGLTTDISTDAAGHQRVMEFSIDRGSSQNAGALVEYAAGTLTLTLRDDNGDLDPATIDEPLPGISIQLSKVWAGEVYPLFTGTVDAWLPEHRWPDQAVVVITASDALASVAGYNRGEIAATGAGQLSGARANLWLDAIGWPAGRRDIDTGTVTLAATTLGGNVLDGLRDTALAEVGDLWATPGGTIRFRDRYGLYLDGATLQATFGSDTAGGELPWVDKLDISYDRTGQINLVRAARDVEGATVFESSDEVSRSRYGDRGPDTFALDLDTDAQVATWVDYVRAREATPQLRFNGITIDPRVNEDALYPLVLGLDFGDRIAVVRRPPGVAADTREAYIRGIRHSFSAPNRWQTSWELEHAPIGSAFIVDDAVHGLLDSNVLIL